MNTKKYECIDLLKGLAALSVLWTHWYGFTYKMPHQTNNFDHVLDIINNSFSATVWASNGIHPGVLIFIVISGFSIHLSTLQKGLASAGTFDFWKSYAIRRFFRIIPVFLVAFLLGIISIFVGFGNPEIRPFFIPESISTILPHKVYGWVNLDNSTLLSVAIIIKLTFLDAFLPFGINLGNGPLYTISVLIWLYLLYPLVLKYIERCGWSKIIALGIVLQLLGPSLNYCMHYYFNKNMDVMPASLIVCFLYWIIGAYAAKQAHHALLHRANNNYTFIMLIVLVLLYLSGGNFFNSFGGSRYLWSLILSVIIGILLYSIVLSESNINQYKLLSGITYVGKSSLSLYAVHTPILALSIMAVLTIYPSSDLVIIRVVSIASIAVVTYLTYCCIERPSQRIVMYLSKIKN